MRRARTGSQGLYCKFGNIWEYTKIFCHGPCREFYSLIEIHHLPSFSDIPFAITKLYDAVLDSASITPAPSPAWIRPSTNISNKHLQVIYSLIPPLPKIFTITSQATSGWRNRAAHVPWQSVPCKNYPIYRAVFAFFSIRVLPART